MIEHGVWRGCNVAFADGRLYIERLNRPNLVGGIARGRIDRVLGKSAFVKLPPYQHTAVMGYLDKAKNVKPGDELLVQVSTYAAGGKAWPLSTEIKLQGRRYIYLPHGKGIATSKRLHEKLARQLKEELILDFPGGLPGGWIIRSGGAPFPHDALEERTKAIMEVKALIEKAKVLGETSGWLIAPPTIPDRAALEARVTTLQELDADDLADRMEDLLRLDIAVGGGARLRLGPTPALFAIDVDSLSGTSQSEDLASEIVRAINNRNIGGQIVIDPIRESSRSLLSDLQCQAGAERSLNLTLYGQTKMGLIELSRPRYGPSLYEALDD